MQAFTGSWANRLGSCFFIAVAGGILYFGVAILLRHATSSNVAGAATFFVLGGGGGAAALWSLLESFASYEFNSEGITRRAWTGTQSLRWSDIVALEASGQKDGTLTLVSHAGRKLRVYTTFLSSSRREQLRELLKPHLAPIRDRQQREVSLPGTVYYPVHTVAWAGLCLLVMTLMVGVAYAFMPVPPDQRGAFYGLMGIVLVCGVGSALLIFDALTYSLMFTEQEIIRRRWMRETVLPYHKVVRVESRMQQNKGASWGLTNVEGDGKKVSFTSKMTGYPLVMGFLKSHVGTEALDRGAAFALESTEKEARRQRIIMPIVTLLYGALLIGFGLWFLNIGNKGIADYRLMDRQGRRAVGQIIGKQIEGGKSTRYLLRFEFDADGTAITSTSPVSRTDYYQARTGAQVPVIYVPGNLRICRVEQSIGRRRAESNIRLGYVNIALAVVGCPVLILYPYLKRGSARASLSRYRPSDDSAMR